MSLEIFREILTRTMTAPVFHLEQRNLHLFISCPGFAALHEYQYYDENITFLAVKKYVIENYNRLPPDDPPEQFEFMQQLIGNKKRFDLSGDDKWKLIKQSWQEYRKWEEGSRDLYEAKAKELFDAGLVTDAKFVQDLAADVSHELAEANDIYLALSGMDFDLPTITSMQLEMAEKWERKKRKLFKEPS